MKICFVGAFPPSKGNLAEYGYYLVCSLARRKEVEEIVVLSNSLPPKDYAIRGYKGRIRVVKSWEANDAFSLLGIIRMVRRENPDLVFFNCHMMSWGGGRIANFFGASLPFVLKRLFGKKTVLCMHNIVETVDFDSFKDKPSSLDMLGAALATSMMLSADKVVVTLNLYLKALKTKYGSDNIVYIPHGTFGKRKVRSPVDGKQLLTFGFWRDTKDLPLLLEAFRDLREEDHGLKLVVAGESHPNFKGYLEMVKRNYTVHGVTYTGYVQEKDLDRVFGSASMVILPYQTMTGSSGVVHLSASYGKPVIITDIEDIRKTTEEEGLKFLLFRKGDKEDLKNAIRKLLSDKKLGHRMAAHNLKIAESLSFDNIAERFVDVFRQVVGEHGS